MTPFKEDEIDGFENLKSRGWRITHLLERDPKQQAYCQMMVEELNKIPYEKKTNTEQFESTKRLLALSDEAASKRREEIKDPEFWNKLYETAQVAKTEEEMDALARKLTPEEVIIYQQMRQSAKNELGQSESSASTPERKEKAVDAFLYTPPAKLTPAQILQVKALQKITMFEGPLPEEKKESWWKRFLPKPRQQENLRMIDKMTNPEAWSKNIKEKK